MEGDKYDWIVVGGGVSGTSIDGTGWFNDVQV